MLLLELLEQHFIGILYNPATVGVLTFASVYDVPAPPRQHILQLVLSTAPPVLSIRRLRQPTGKQTLCLVNRVQFEQKF